jgi:hypothetical protein
MLNGVEFEALLIPAAQYMPRELEAFIREHDSFPVYVVGGKPTADFNGIALGELAQFLREKGMYRVSLTPQSSSIALYHYKKEGQLFLLFNENPNETYTGRVVLPDASGYAYYNGWKDCYEKAAVVQKNGACEVEISLEPGESCLLCELTEGMVCTAEHQSFAAQLRACTSTASWREAAWCRPISLN